MYRFLLLLLLFQGFEGKSQSSGQAVTLVHYALDSFQQGRVLLISGTSSPQRLNYNLLTGEMIFVSGSQYLAVANPNEIDTVFIGNKKFVPVGNRFYEWLGGKQPALFKEYACSVNEPGTETGFGTTNTTAASSLRSIIQTGGAYQLKLPDGFKVVPQHLYWIRHNGKYVKVKNGQGVAKLFPAKKEVLAEWQKNHSGLADEEMFIGLTKALQ